MENGPKLAREYKTIETMVELYCGEVHKAGESVCTSCRELLSYARLRLDKCPFGEEKPKCANCKIHCYKPDMRGKVRDVMKYAGPRMLLKHPAMVLRHAMQGVKNPFSKGG